MSKKRKSRTEWKKRSRLLFRDFGRANDLKLWGTSSTVYKTSLTYGITYGNPDWLLSQYYLGERSRSMQVSPACDWLGAEEICTSVGRRDVMNDCVHVKTRAKNLPYLLLSEQYNSSTKMNVVYYTRSAVSSVSRDVGAIALGLGFGRNGMDQQFSARAYWSMRPRFEGDVSIVNSIFELKDFKDVVNLSKQLGNLRNVAREIREYSYKAVASRRKVLLEQTSPLNTVNVLARDITGTAANAQLTYSLAIMPTIMDFMAITAQLLTDCQERQQAFKDYGEIGTTSHFTEGDFINSTTSGPYNGYTHGTGLTLTTVRTATMRSKYSYIMRDRNEALRKYWGLTGTAEQLHNMLPLSFIGDYFVGLNKVLSYMNWDENVTDLKTEYCESLRCTAASGVHLLISPRTPCVILDGKFVKIPKQGLRSLLVSGYEGTFYERKVMEPYKGPALPRIKVPSSNQAANLLALARVFIS